MPVQYAHEPDAAADEVARVFRSSGLNRPVDDLDRIGRMIAGADLMICARDDGHLVGVARSITDFSFCCYLSDLAVARSHQRQGIGKALIRMTRAAMGPECVLLLLAARTAEGYYPHLGFEPAEKGWMLNRAK